MARAEPLAERLPERREPVLRVEALSKDFDVSSPWLVRMLQGGERQVVKAIDGVGFEIRKGETLSLVGESGCGKSTIARCVVGLHRPSAGRILFDGGDRNSLHGRPLKRLRRRVQMIFQDPYASLNPRWRVFDIIAEPIRTHRLAASAVGVRRRVEELLVQVKMNPADGRKYPHQFSGGQRQRISIARALASEPEFLVCDEPTSALDVSVQAQILNLMRSLQRELGLTYLFISHNLAVVAHVSDYVGVMYLGRLVELAPARTIFRNPQHPYTRLLMETVPQLKANPVRRMPVAGEVPNPIKPPSGCHFHPRCPFANERCRNEIPQTIDSGKGQVRCHAVAERRLLPETADAAAI